jgi:hypothetical protein
MEFNLLKLHNLLKPKSPIWLSEQDIHFRLVSLYKLRAFSSPILHLSKVYHIMLLLPE